MQTETSVEVTGVEQSGSKCGPYSTVNELEALGSEMITDFWQESG